MQFLWKYIDDLVGKGLDFSVIAELMLYASATLVPMALPLAILLSSIMTFGNLGENNELMALKSAGISLIRIMMPLILFIGLVSIGAFFFSNNVMPYTNLKMGALLWDVRHQKPEVSVKEGVFYDAIDGFTIKVGKKSKKTSMLYDIMIYDHRNNDGNRVVTKADSGTMTMTSDNKYLVLTLFSGTSYDELAEKKRRDDREFPSRVDKFGSERMLIDMSGLAFARTDEDLFKNHYQMLNLKQLAHAVDSLGSGFETRKKIYTENLEKSNYFKRIPSSKYAEIWGGTDTMQQESLNIDSLFEALPAKRKQMVFDNAMNYARSTKAYISATNSELSHKQQWIKRHEIEWHRKFTLSFACFILFFIGAPLGAIIRKGGLGMPVVTSVLFFVVYYVISISGEKSAKIGAWPSWLGMWISSMILFPLGIFLTYKAVNDSVILNVDTYIEVFKKFFLFRKNLRNRLKRKHEQLAKKRNKNRETNLTKNNIDAD